VVKSESTGQFVMWCHLDVSENTVRSVDMKFPRPNSGRIFY
jgi:hypothetical protein